MIVAVAGEADEKDKQLIEAVALLLVTFAVSVTPPLRIKVPVPAFEISEQVTLVVIVIVWLLAQASSAAPGTTPPTHVEPLLKSPLATDSMSAII